MPYFSQQITLGNLLSIFAFLAAALFAWRDLNWRVKNLEAWREMNMHTEAEELRNITMLREAIAAIREMATGQERRIQMLEDRPQDWRRQ